MNELIEKRQHLIDKISKYNAKLFNLQNELLNVEQSIVQSDHKEIMKTLTLNKQQLQVNVAVKSKSKKRSISQSISTIAHLIISRSISRSISKKKKYK